MTPEPFNRWLPGATYRVTFLRVLNPLTIGVSWTDPLDSRPYILHVHLAGLAPLELWPNPNRRPITVIDYLRSLLRDKPVYVIPKTASPDVYGTILARVATEAEHDISAALVRDGWALPKIERFRA